MRLPVAAAFLVLLLTGCSSIARVGADSFEAGRTSPEAFDNDNLRCRLEADNRVNYDMRLMDGTVYERNRAFNASYEACMKARGYTARPYLQNLLP
jgi:hypothetical protein